MSEKIQNILELGHPIGNRDTLKYWRDTVPQEARKIWLRSFVTEVASEKLQSERYRHILEQSLSPEIQAILQEKDARIAEAEEKISELSESDDGETYEIDDAIFHAEEVRDNLLLEREEFILRQIDDSVLQKFAEYYFTSFDTDEEAQRRFERLQQEAAKKLAQILSIHMPEIDTIILAGSSAIGKRLDNQIQDIDFLLLLQITTSEETLERYKEFLLNISILLNPVEDVDDKEDARASLEEFPEWQSLIEFFEENNILPDLKLAQLPEETEDSETKKVVEDWRKLTGPHRVLAKLSETSDETYQIFLHFAIDSARVEARYLRTN